MKSIWCILLITLCSCAGMSYDNPLLVGYLTQEECRIGKGLDVNVELPPECSKLAENGF